MGSVRLLGNQSPSCQPRADWVQSPSCPENGPARQSDYYYPAHAANVTMSQRRLAALVDDQATNSQLTCPSDKRELHGAVTRSLAGLQLIPAKCSQAKYTSSRPLQKNTMVQKRAPIGGAICPAPFDTNRSHSPGFTAPRASGRCHRDLVSIFRDI